MEDAMAWTPRSQRLGITNYDGPFEGVPAHLKPQLKEWLQSTLDGTAQPEEVANVLALRLRVAMNPTYVATSYLVSVCSANDDLMLDAVEGVLQFPQKYGYGDRREELQSLLELSGSKYAVGSDGLLVDAVNASAQQTFDMAIEAGDEVADNLQEAWVKAFGRTPDPSDAWDHAIKATECVLKPSVEPSNAKGTLGSMIGVLAGNPGGWRCVFPGVNKDHAVDQFVSLLRLIWPNPDRHGPATRKPTLEEARAVVTLTAAIVQWDREGTVVARR